MVSVLELMMGVDEVQIQDSNYISNPRKKRFINVNALRSLYSKKEDYIFFGK